MRAVPVAIALVVVYLAYVVVAVLAVGLGVFIGWLIKRRRRAVMVRGRLVTNPAVVGNTPAIFDYEITVDGTPAIAVPVDFDFRSTDPVALAPPGVFSSGPNGMSTTVATNPRGIASMNVVATGEGLASLTISATYLGKNASDPPFDVICDNTTPSR